MPMTEIEEESRADFLGTVVFFCVLMLLVAIVLGLGLRWWVALPLIHENSQLKREAESQSNFLTIITHELKTPLSSIIAFVELWKKRGVTGVTQDECVEEIENNSKTLLSLVNNLLNTARLDEGSIVPVKEDTDIYDVVYLVRAVANPIAKRKGIELTYSIEPEIPIFSTDREMLRQIILNLVSNALRYTTSGGSVCLALSYGDKVMKVVVSDTGAGISADELPHVFDRFANAGRSIQSGEGGTGLGLSIVKRYVEMLGGSVQAESKLGVGSVFTVCLPVEPCEDESDFS